MSKYYQIQQNNFKSTGKTNDITTEDEIDIKSLNIELHLWGQTYNEVTRIFKNIIQIPDATGLSHSEKRAALIQICKEVAKVALNPKDSKDYRDLQKALSDCQNGITELARKRLDSVESSAIEQSPKPISEVPETSQVVIRLNNLENFLSREIEKNMQYLPNGKSPLDENDDGNASPTKKLQSGSPKSKGKKRKNKNKDAIPKSSEILSPSFHDNSKNNPSPRRSLLRSSLFESDSIELQSSSPQRPTKGKTQTINKTKKGDQPAKRKRSNSHLKKRQKKSK